VLGVEAAGPGRWRVHARSDRRNALARAVTEAGGTLEHLRLAEPSLTEIYARCFRDAVPREVRDAA
jgi:hypothetical protein